MSPTMGTFPVECAGRKRKRRGVHRGRQLDSRDDEVTDNSSTHPAILMLS
jgi:hypothetical protein